MFEEQQSLELCNCQRSSLKQILDSVNIKSSSNIITVYDSCISVVSDRGKVFGVMGVSEVR